MGSNKTNPLRPRPIRIHIMNKPAAHINAPWKTPLTCVAPGSICIARPKSPTLAVQPRASVAVDLSSTLRAF